MGLHSAFALEPQVHRFLYSFADDAGAQGTVDLGDLPDNFIVTGFRTNVVTAVTSDGSATIAFGDETTADKYLTATAKGGFDTEDEMQVEAAILNLKCTSEATRGVQMTIGGADLKTGAVEVYITGFVAKHTAT